MKRIDDEFAFQARELDEQIAGILGDPPNRKNYQAMLAALFAEYSKKTIVEDVNLLSFALVDQLNFLHTDKLVAAAKKYDAPHPDSVAAFVTCTDAAYQTLLNNLFATHPALTRKAVLVAFLHKNQNAWLAQEREPNAEDEDDGEDDDVEESDGPSADVIDMFDELPDPHEH
ncbi:MAG: hypothetical protein ACXW1C_04475 [Gallionella sp.]